MAGGSLLTLAVVAKVTNPASARVNISKKILKDQGILKVYYRCSVLVALSPDKLIDEFS